MHILQPIAASIFARQGVDFATVQRAGGWTNAVWLAADLVLRLSTTTGNDSLLREARLAALFPPAVGYPTILEIGTTAGTPGAWRRDYLAGAWVKPGPTCTGTSGSQPYAVYGSGRRPFTLLP
jgi:hypothetical protein